MRNRLSRALDRRPAILHLTCHGRVVASDVGPLATLLLEDEDGGPDVLRAEHLINALPRDVVRLVVLSACQTSLARALVRAGTPAALGMQGNFPDAASDALAATLYEQLAHGRDLGEATRLMRSELALEHPEAVGLPAVYIAPPDGLPDVAELTQLGKVDLPTALVPPTPFLGREAALNALAKSKREGEKVQTPVVTVVGTGGIGKSALAGAFARRFAWRYPGGVVGVTLADSATLNPKTMLLELLRRLGVPTTELADRPPAEINEQLLRILRDRPALVVVDNYESVLQVVEREREAEVEAEEEAKAEGEVGERMWLEAGAEENAAVLYRLLADLARDGRPLLLTSRRQPAGFAGEVQFPPGDHATLAGVDEDAGAALFFQHSTRAQAERNADRTLARSVAAATEGHPLAIALLAGEWDDSTELSREEFLADWDRELAAARRPGMAEHHVTFRVAFDRSWHALTRDEQQQLAALGRFSAPFFVEGAALLWHGALPEDEAAARAVLERFRRRSLLRVEGTFTGSDRVATYRLEPVIQRALLARLEEPAALDERYAAYAAWLLDRAHGETGRDVALNRLTLAWLDELILQAAQQPTEGKANYCWKLGYLCRQFGRIDDGIHLLAEGLEVAAAANDEEMLSRLKHERANVYVVRGDLAEALRLYEESLAIQEQLGDLHGWSATLDAIANVHVMKDNFDEALRFYEESLATDEKVGNREGRAATLYRIAYLCKVRGDLNKALQLCEQSLAIYKTLGDLKGRSAVLHQMAYVHIAQDDLEEALQLYRESLSIQEELSDVQGQSATLSQIAHVSSLLGHTDEPLQYFEKSLEIQRNLGDLPGRGATLSQMAYVYAALDDRDNALRLYKESLAIKNQLGDIKGRGATLSEMADVLRTGGELTEAEQLLIESLRIAKQIGQPDGVAFDTVKLGQIAQARGDHAAARQRYAEGLAIFERIGMPRESEQVRAMLAALEGEPEEPPRLSPGQALVQLTVSALAAVRGRRDVEPVVDVLAQVAEQGGFEPAAAAYLQALADALTAGDAAAAATGLHTAVKALLAADPLADEADAAQLWPALLHNAAGLLGVRQQWAAAAAIESEAVARLRTLGDERANQEVLRILLTDYAAFLAHDGQQAEAVAAQQEVVAIAEALELDTLDQDRQTLAALRQARAAAAQAPLGDAAARLQAQVEHLSDDERAALMRQADAFARLSPEERQAVLDRQARARIDAQAELLERNVLELIAEGHRADLPAKLDDVAAIWAEGDDPAEHELAQYMRAVAALLGRAPVPPVPEHFVERFAALRSALG